MAGAKKTPEKQKTAAAPKGGQQNSKSMNMAERDDDEALDEDEDEDEDMDEDEDEDENDFGDDDDDDDEAETGTADTDYNLVSVLYHSLQGAETYAEYADDAADSDDEELETFFREVQREEQKRADRAKQLLGQRLMRESGGRGRMPERTGTKPAPM